MLVRHGFTTAKEWKALLSISAKQLAKYEHQGMTQREIALAILYNSITSTR